jgi:flagellar hook-length control protein FliK
MPDPATAESLTQDVEDKLNANEKQGEAGSRSGARSEAVNDSVAETADQDGSETGEQAGRNGNGSQQAMSTANRAQTSTNGSNEQSSEFQQKFESSLGMGTADGSSQKAGTTGAAGSRAAIPTYVVRQVATQISQMVKQGNQVLRLTLKPADLGSMKVELSVEQSVIKASLTVDTVTAKHTLEAGMEQLRQNLAQQGFKVDRIEVSVNTENQDQQQAQSGEQGSGQQNRRSISGVAIGSDSEGDIWAQTEDLSVDQAASEQSGISLFA